MSLHADVAAKRGGFELEFQIGVAAGETVAVVGESGAGKTTALRCLAGLLRPLRGSIVAGDTVWFDNAARIFVPAPNRDVAMVFSRGALFDHMTALENVEFGLQAGGCSRSESLSRAAEALQLVAGGELAARRASLLSGGERQRVALARAVALRPSVLLLDEPLTGLDHTLRPRVREALQRAIEATQAATVLVVHEPEEALLFARRFMVMDGGRSVQAGDLAALRERPASSYIASFAGTNLFRGKAQKLGDGASAVRLAETEIVVLGEYEGEVSVVVDPDAVTLSTEALHASARNHLSGVVENIATDRGAFRVSLASQPPIAARVTAASLAALDVAPGKTLHASFKALEARVL